MKTIIAYWVSLIIIGLLFSCGGKKEKTDELMDPLSPENALDWLGTYEGVLPAADGPGIYVLLSIDSTSYERAYKYINHPGIDVSMGNIKWNSGKDTLTLVADHQSFFVHDGILSIGVFQLVKISDEIKLPRLLITQTLKDDKSGVNAILEQYSVGKRSLANFYFDDKTP